MSIVKPVGKFSEKKARKYLIIGLLWLIPLMVSYFTTYSWSPIYVNVGNFESIRGLLTGVFLTLGVVYLWQPYSTWKSGSIGEKRVERILSNQLSREYLIYSNVLLKDQNKGDIDHIVVGPKGIFVLETKNNSGKIEYNGYVWKGIIGNPSKQLVSNMFRIKDILKRNCSVFENKELHLNACLVFSNPKAKVEGLGRKICSNVPYDVFHLVEKSDNCLSNYITNGIDYFSNQEIEIIGDCINSKIGNPDE
jgi:hypothetical protein